MQSTAKFSRSTDLVSVCQLNTTYLTDKRKFAFLPDLTLFAIIVASIKTKRLKRHDNKSEQSTVKFSKLTFKKLTLRGIIIADFEKFAFLSGSYDGHC